MSIPSTTPELVSHSSQPLREPTKGSTDPAKERLNEWKRIARCRLDASQNVLWPILDPSRVSQIK
ncbi:MAG: hypothetical protein K2X39_07175 [Silvanigrellaceae bacterium]|jgi:hypothetical protein|nr:hypothetical protein [Silvanigrellaceae bacterium]